MQMINYFMVLLVIFSMVALGEIFKLKKEVRKLNKITDFLSQLLYPCAGWVYHGCYEHTC